MIKLDKVSKKFGTGVFGLSEISFSVEKGEFVFLVGPTGAGKTTVFKLLIKEVDPTEGEITLGEWDLTKLPKSKVPLLRKKVGVVFQDLKLLLDRTVSENILLPLDVMGLKHEEAKRKAEEILSQVGILEHKDKFPVQLSGGELQRAAIARALVLEPEVLLADEPTGNLDSATSWDIVKLLSDINEKGTTIIMATHNTDIIKSLKKRVIKLEKGVMVKEEKDEKEEKADKHVREEKEDAKGEGKTENILAHGEGGSEAEESKKEKDPEKKETKDEKEEKTE